MATLLHTYRSLALLSGTVSSRVSTAYHEAVLSTRSALLVVLMSGEEAARALTIVVHIGRHLILVPGLGAKGRARLATAASIEIPRHLLTQSSILAGCH